MEKKGIIVQFDTRYEDQNGVTYSQTESNVFNKKATLKEISNWILSKTTDPVQPIRIHFSDKYLDEASFKPAKGMKR